jgi:outer membrane protein assembly factor BamB
LIRASSATLALAFLTSACGALQTNENAETANDRINPERPMWVSRPTPVLQTLFRKELTSKSKTSGEDYEHGQAEIDPKTGRVFVGSADGGLYALRASDGSTLWRFQTTGAVQSEPSYDAELDMVFFGSNDGALYAVKAYDGTLVYRFSSGAEISKKATVRGETVYFANAADHIFALNRRTGKVRWQAFRPSALGMEVAGYAAPTVFGDSVYAAYSDGHVTAYDAATGQEKWSPVDLTAEADTAALGSESTRYLDVDTTPIVVGTPEAPIVYVASYAAGVFALDGRTGAKIWGNDRATGVTELSLYREPARKDRSGVEVPETAIILAASASTGLWALEADVQKQGRELWRNKVPEGGIARPVGCAGTLVIGTSKFGLLLLSPRTGKPIDGIDSGTGFSQAPAVYGNHIYALSNGGTFYGLEVLDPRGHGRRSEAAILR